MTGRRRRARAAAPVRGTVSVPGDLATSRAALAVAALADGSSVVSGVNPGAEVLALTRALTALGAGCRVVEGDKPRAVVETLPGGLREPHEVLIAGTTRASVATLLALCSTVAGLSVVAGEGRVKGVPMLGMVSLLRQMGAAIDGRSHANLLPLVVRGGGLVGLELELSGRAPDAKTAAAIAAVRADGDTSILERVATSTELERVLEAAGAGVEVTPRGIVVRGGASLGGVEHDVPGDLSAAMGLVVAGALLPGSDLTVADVGIDPMRKSALDVLGHMGAVTELADQREVSGHPVAAIRVRASALDATEVDQDAAERAVVDLPVLIVAATQASGDTRIALPPLERQERGSLEVLVAGLRGLGADVDINSEEIVTRGPATLAGGEVDSGADPLVALAFAVAGLLSPDRVRVKRWGCMGAWFPDFADVVARARKAR